MRSTLRLVALLACAVWTSLQAAVAFGATRPPNIVHIVGDDVAYDDLSCYGAPKIKTPALDKLASQGVRLTSFYAPSPVCTPSRAAMITGCYAQRVGLPSVLFPNDNYGLSDKEITIAQLLKGKGYATALIGKWHNGCQPQFLPHRHGFDLFYGIPYPNDHGPERAHSNKQTKPFPPIPLYRNDTVEQNGADLQNCPDKFADEVVKFMTDHKDEPFFIHYAPIETHTPWYVPKRFEGKSADGSFGDAVECMDSNVGRVMETLEKLGIAENTIVVFNSDNGPLWKRHEELEQIYGKFGTVDPARPHVLRGGKYNARLEGGVRVSAIARWPGQIPAGSVNDELVAGFDLFTTFAHIGGAEIPTDRIIDGKDVLAVLKSEPGAKSPHEALYYYQNFELVAVRGPTWKLLFPDKQNPKPELYDVKGDIGEKSDQLTAKPEVADQLRKVAAEAREDLGDARKQTEGKNRRPPGIAPEADAPATPAANSR